MKKIGQDEHKHRKNTHLASETTLAKIHFLDLTQNIITKRNTIKRKLRGKIHIDNKGK